MYTAAEEMKSGEFTGFIVEAEDKEDLLEKLGFVYCDPSCQWFITEKASGINYRVNESHTDLDII